VKPALNIDAHRPDRRHRQRALFAVADAAEPRRGPQRLALVADGRRLFLTHLAQGVTAAMRPARCSACRLRASRSAGVIGQPEEIFRLEGRRVEIDLLQRIPASGTWRDGFA
jgi:hypothetical protein